VVSGYGVAFAKLSEDTSGKATLFAGSSGDRALGVVYEISSADADALDVYEGPGYARTEHFGVTCLQTGDRLPTISYFARTFAPDLQPYDWYLALVLAGLHEHAFDSGYVQLFRSTAFTADPDRSRATRLNALRDLREAGYANYTDLFGPGS